MCFFRVFWFKKIFNIWDHFGRVVSVCMNGYVLGAYAAPTTEIAVEGLKFKTGSVRVT